MRASDGGELVRLTSGFDGLPPAIRRMGRGRVHAHQARHPARRSRGAVRRRRGGGRPLRITPWGASFLDNAWSPDGEWIAFQRPYGQLFLVRPDGTGLHRVYVRLPHGAGVRTPSWSPDGEWIIFSMQRASGATIWAVRPDGTDLQRITTSRDVDQTLPDWSG